MSDDLTARLRQAERERDELIEWQNELASRMPEEWDGDEAQEELISRYFEHLQARAAERDAAVRLLEVCPVGQGAIPGQFVVSATGGFFMPSLAEWERERRAFLAHHKEGAK